MFYRPAGLELTDICLPLSSECWDYRNTPLSSLSEDFFVLFKMRDLEDYEAWFSPTEAVQNGRLMIEGNKPIVAATRP